VLFTTGQLAMLKQSRVRKSIFILGRFIQSGDVEPTLDAQDSSFLTLPRSKPA